MKKKRKWKNKGSSAKEDVFVLKTGGRSRGEEEVNMMKIRIYEGRSSLRHGSVFGRGLVSSQCALGNVVLSSLYSCRPPPAPACRPASVSGRRRPVPEHTRSGGHTHRHTQTSTHTHTQTQVSKWRNIPPILGEHARQNTISS
jgi:hypothetical protein